MADRPRQRLCGPEQALGWPNEAGMDARLQDVCTVCIEAFRLLTLTSSRCCRRLHWSGLPDVISPLRFATPPPAGPATPSATST
jgi:hypothetical protein